MRSGGSPDKGGDFERKVNKQLSLWISRGERADIFRRNTGSGGAFTNALKRGVTSGIPGDTLGSFELAFDYPLATKFLKLFMPEHKHWRDLKLEQALWKSGGEFDKILRKAEQQATDARREPWIIARQNYKPTLLFVPYSVGIYGFGRLLPGLVYHGLWNNRIFACLFDEALKADPERFIHITENR